MGWRAVCSGFGRLGGAGLLCAAVTLVGCSGEMSPTVTVDNQTDQIARGVQVGLAGATLDIPPLRSGEKARLPYTPVAGTPHRKVEVLWGGKVTALPLPAVAAEPAPNNIELVLTSSGVQFDN